MKNRIIPGIGIGIVFHWLSLFFSYRELPNIAQDINEPIAIGGFPFKAFEYPVPPMGNGLPTEMLPMFFLNLAIWIAIGLLVALVSNKKIENKKVIISISLVAIILSVFGVLYLMLKFD